MGKVSIIVPIYNAEKYLSECIESLRNQTYQNIEVILINDGSTDNSLPISSEYAEKDKRIVLKTIANSGVSIARNIGLDLASGTFVMFVDSDDWLEETTVELAVEKITETQSDLVIWSYFKNYFDKELSQSLVPGESRSFENEEEKEILYLKSIYANYETQNNMEEVSIGTVMCKLYRSDFLIKNKLKFKPKLIRAEDVVFALNAFKYAKKITYFDEKLYHYRMSDSSICSASRYIKDTKTPFNLLLMELKDFQGKVGEVRDLQKVLDGRTIQALLWHLKYHYYHESNNQNLLKMRKEVIKLIKMEPYRSAILNVDLKLVPKQEKLMVILFRRRLVICYYIFQKLINKRNKAKVEKYE